MAEMTPDYVRALFDQYAPRFDRALREHLDYRGPEVLRDAVVEARHSAKKPVHFARALDLGCGTGLAADAFASLVDEITGVDLSPGMLAKAAKRKFYTVLKEADMLAALNAEGDASFDLVMAADAVVYVPDLAQICLEAARVLRPGGRFAVSDVIADPGMDEATRADMQEWTGCIAGALTRAEFEDALSAAGLEQIEIDETHRVHEHASSAIVRARKPATA